MRKKTTFSSETGFGPLLGTSRRLAFSEFDFDNFFVGGICMGVDGVDGVDLLITFFLAVKILVYLAHSIWLDGARKMG